MFEYDHEDGKSVTGGFVYRGSQIPALQGMYIFADFVGGEVITERRLFAGDLDTGEFEQLLLAPGSQNIGQPVSFGQDADGELYVVSVDGRILSINPIAAFGDLNGDGVTHQIDVAPFVALLSNGGFQTEADINQDGMVNLLDVDPFILILGG